MSALRSRDNARVRRWRTLAHDGRARRTEARTLIEGAHLVAACLAAGIRPVSLLVSERGRGGLEDVAVIEVDREGEVGAREALGAREEIELLGARLREHVVVVVLVGERLDLE